MVFKRQISIGTPKSKNKWCDHAHDRAIGPRSGKNFQFLWPNRDTTAIKSKISLSRVILRFENESIYYLWESIFFPCTNQLVVFLTCENSFCRFELTKFKSRPVSLPKPKSKVFMFQFDINQLERKFDRKC